MTNKIESSKKKYDVITVGGAVIDQYVRSSAFETKKDNQSLSGFDTCFPLGAKLPIDEIEIQTGGGATNAGVTFGRLGLKTAIIARIGKDLYGDLIKDVLTEERIHTDLLQTDKEHRTAQSIIFLADIGHRTIFVHRGASALINKREIPWSSLQTRWFYITSVGGDLSLISMILDRAEACGASVCWNPGSAELKKGLSKLAPLIKRVDILDLNREESAQLTEKPIRHLKSIVQKLGIYPRIGLLITDGPNGAYLHTKCCTWYAPPLPAKRVNTTGAGDAFGSGFIAGFIPTCDLHTAMKVGMLNSLGVITHMGAKTGILKEWPKKQVLDRVIIRSVRLHD
jgi:sugar/nucleoside kinase (ribokinase family)